MGGGGDTEGYVLITRCLCLTPAAQFICVECLQVCTGVMLHGYSMVKQLCGELQV